MPLLTREKEKGMRKTREENGKSFFGGNGMTVENFPGKNFEALDLLGYADQIGVCPN